MAKTKIGANAIFSGPQKGLSIIGQHCYAYSGLVQVTTAREFLSFTTGKDLIVANFQFTLGEDTTDNIVWEVTINGNIISGSLNESGQAGNPLEPLLITLPPFSFVEVNATNFTGTPTQRKCYAIVQGKVYDA